jgi:hypothetical protein
MYITVKAERDVIGTHEGDVLGACISFMDDSAKQKETASPPPPTSSFNATNFDLSAIAAAINHKLAHPQDYFKHKRSILFLLQQISALLPVYFWIIRPSLIR